MRNYGALSHKRYFLSAIYAEEETERLQESEVVGDTKEIVSISSKHIRIDEHMNIMKSVTARLRLNQFKLSRVPKF